jgi:hypothetical protein
MELAEGWVAVIIIGAFIAAIFVLNAIEFGRVD